MTYDAANELIGIHYSDGKTPNVTGITYDADGQRTGLTDGTGTSSWTWDSLHRLTSYMNGAGSSVQYQYDLRNLITAIAYPGGSRVVTRSYDDAGRWITVTDWIGNMSRFSYDADGNLAATTLPGSVVDSYTYDAADRLAQISDVQGAVHVLFAAAYGRDPNSQLTSDTSVAPSAGSFKYTALNQLCYASSGNSSACSAPPSGALAYVYDAADNLIQTETPTQSGPQTQAFNAADQLCWTAPGVSSNSCGNPAPGSTIYTYDSRGNRTSATLPIPRSPVNQSMPASPQPRVPMTGAPTSSQRLPMAPQAGVNQSPPGVAGSRGVNPSTPASLIYDQVNRLVDYNGSALYAYNADGLRMSKQVSGATTNFTWNSSGVMSLLMEEQTGSNLTDYIYGPGGQPLEQVTVGGIEFLHHDQLGSTRLLTDSAGSLLATYSFDPYGNLTTSAGNGLTTLQFAGQYHDSESGFLYLRARYYDPQTAQFISRDPEVSRTREPYQYVSGDPLNSRDLSGLDCGWLSPWDCVTSIASTVAAGVATVASGVGGALVNTLDYCTANAGNIATCSAALALATSWIPGVDVLTATFAVVGAGASVAAGIQDVQTGKPAATTLLDLTGAVGGIGSIIELFRTVRLTSDAVALIGSGNVDVGVNQFIKAQEVNGYKQTFDAWGNAQYDVGLAYVLAGC
jgi:RHS repeat-associated protein